MQSKSILSSLLVAGLALAACNATRQDSTPNAPAKPVPAPLTELDGTAYETALRVSLPEVQPMESIGLHNIYELSDSILSGSEPEAEEAFAYLRDQGVKTILSVDGKEPDAETAAKYGIRYVHVPIQYKGIEPDEVLRIAKTFREAEGPFYVHCFHGKHRGPAAAAIGRVALDGAPREQAIAEMRQWCGTSSSYEGLYGTIAQAQIPSYEATAAFDWDFPSAHPFTGLRQGMIAMARSHDHLKALAGNDWIPTSHHPDVDAVNEATLLVNNVQKCADSSENTSCDAQHQEFMADTLAKAEQLKELVLGLGRGETEKEEASLAFEAVMKSCKTCHKVYRN